MRAVIATKFGSVDDLEVQDLADPEPGPGEVIVQTAAIGVNFPDLLVVSGDYQIRPPLPFSPGKECSGTVIKVGEDVSDIKEGDRVLAQVEYGAYAEQVRAPALSCHLLPDNMDFARAITLGLTYQTAWFALRDRAHIAGGEFVLVTGASGGVGLATLQIAKAFGCVVIAGVRSDAQAAFVRKHGAELLVRLDDENLHENLKAEVFAMTNDHGADVIVDTVGGHIFDASMRALGWRGRMIVVGFAGGTIPSVKTGYLLVKNVSVVGLDWSDYRDRRPEWVRQAQKEIFELFAKGSLDPEVMGRFPLGDFAQALTAVAKGGLQGKVELDPSK
jgi:NADPH2:quinone reductase